MLEKKDLTFAFILHIGVVLLVVVLNAWQVEHKPTPERLIQVNMVSLAELQAMMKKQRLQPAASHEETQKKKANKKKPNKQKPNPKKHKKSNPVIQPKKTSKAKKKVVEDPDYDPFAPLESSPSKAAQKKSRNTKEELKTLLKGQLSAQEMNRYIAGMQAAVERQWKVPMEMMERLKPALVRLTLSRTGNIVKIFILESSGSALLDDTLKKAIYAAAPFRLPDKQFELFRSNTIRFYPLK